ncbi:hypothetical protein BJX63DRAFT_436161 [Aspergillus granulosus]|uniref:Uncharacterized protein n=1 Tax=Aspergillus granulosus TaxID=176169 RepID=A0ABR4GZ34_9EURO
MSAHKPCLRAFHEYKKQEESSRTETPPHLKPFLNVTFHPIPFFEPTLSPSAKDYDSSHLLLIRAGAFWLIMNTVPMGGLVVEMPDEAERKNWSL